MAADILNGNLSLSERMDITDQAGVMVALVSVGDSISIERLNLRAKGRGEASGTRAKAVAMGLAHFGTVANPEDTNFAKGRFLLRRHRRRSVKGSLAMDVTFPEYS